IEEADHRHQVRRAFAAAKRLAAGAVIGAQLVAQFRCDEDPAAILPSMAIDPSGSGSGSSSLAAISVSARKARRSSAAFEAALAARRFARSSPRLISTPNP